MDALKGLHTPLETEGARLSSSAFPSRHSHQHRAIYPAGLGAIHVGILRALGEDMVLLAILYTLDRSRSQVYAAGSLGAVEQKHMPPGDGAS